MWERRTVPSLQWEIGASWRSHDHCLIKGALLPTPTAFCQRLIWIDAGVSVQNPRLPPALRAHFCPFREGSHVKFMSALVLLYLPTVQCFPECLSCFGSLSRGEKKKDSAEQEMSGLLWQREASFQTQTVYISWLLINNISLMNLSCSHTTTARYSASCCGCLIPLRMTLCLQLQTQKSWNRHFYCLS